MSKKENKTYLIKFDYDLTNVIEKIHLRIESMFHFLENEIIQQHLVQ